MGWYVGVYPNLRTVVFQSFTTPTKKVYPELDLIMGPFKSWDNADESRVEAVNILRGRMKNPRRRNPGAKWHDRKGREAAILSDTATLESGQRFWKRVAAAHAESSAFSRRHGMINPRRRKNPLASQHGTVIYENIEAIQAQKGKDSLWPDEHFEHKFKKGARVIGLPNGDLLIKSKKGKKLWKEFDYD